MDLRKHFSPLDGANESGGSNSKRARRDCRDVVEPKGKSKKGSSKKNTKETLASRSNAADASKTAQCKRTQDARASSKKKKKTKSSTKGVVEDTTEYEVERIVSCREDGKGGMEFLVRWKGYKSTDDSYVPETAFAQHPRCLSEFFETTTPTSTTLRRLASIPKVLHPSNRGNPQLHALRLGLTQSALIAAKVDTGLQARDLRIAKEARRIPKDQPNTRELITKAPADDMAMLVDEILPFYNDVASEAAILLLQEQLVEAKQAPKKVVKARKLVDSWTGTIRRMAIRLDTLVVALSAERDATTTAAKETFRRRVMSIYSEICDTNDLRTQYPSVDHFANYPLHNLEAHEQVIVVNKNGTEHQKKPHWECCVCKASGQQSLFTSSSLNHVKNHILRQHHRDRANPAPDGSCRH
eukprot:m.391339 g.391339  ORF g.391339 m.391339 type:complete len:412 (+) comp16759_c6_seq6:62-1297(+)